MKIIREKQTHNVNVERIHYGDEFVFSKEDRVDRRVEELVSAPALDVLLRQEQLEPVLGKRKGRVKCDGKAMSRTLPWRVP